MENNIKAIRQKLDMSQVKFANYMEIPLPNIQKWEAGRTNPPEYVYNLILRILKNDYPDIDFKEGL